MVMQHERQLNNSIPDESNILTNAVDYHKPQGRGFANGSSFTHGNKKVCTNYGINGHTIDTCYRKHGFPPHFGKNHIVANQSCLESTEEREDIDDSRNCRGNANYGFSKEQYDQLMHLLHASRSNHNVYTRKVNHASHIHNATT